MRSTSRTRTPPLLIDRRIGGRFGAFSEFSRHRAARMLFLGEQRVRKLCAMISASEGLTNYPFSSLSAAREAERVS